MQVAGYHYWLLRQLLGTVLKLVMGINENDIYDSLLLFLAHNFSFTKPQKLTMYISNPSMTQIDKFLEYWKHS